MGFWLTRWYLLLWNSVSHLLKYWLYNELVLQELRQVSCTVEIHYGCLLSQRRNGNFCTHKILVLLWIIMKWARSHISEENHWCDRFGCNITYLLKMLVAEWCLKKSFVLLGALVESGRRHFGRKVAPRPCFNVESLPRAGLTGSSDPWLNCGTEMVAGMCRALSLDKGLPGKAWPSPCTHNIRARFIPAHTSLRRALPGLSEAAQAPGGSCKVLCTGKHIRARTVWLEPGK